MLAIRKNDEKLVKALLAKGANVKLKNEEKMTALDIAKKLKLKNLILLLITDSPQIILTEGLSQSPFNKELIRKALNQGAILIEENKRGKTAL